MPTASASARVYFLTHYISVPIPGGIRGQLPGTRVTLIKNFGDHLRVRADDLEFDVKADQITNDFAVAGRASQLDAIQQQQLADQFRARLQQKSEQQQREIAQGIQSRQQDEKTASRMPNKPFFDDPNYKSIFDRDRERAQKGEQELYRRIREKTVAAPTGNVQIGSNAESARSRARDAQSRIEDLQRRINEVRSDERYQYNKAATEKGNRATYSVEEAADREVNALQRNIDDARNEKSYWEHRGQDAEQY